MWGVQPRGEEGWWNRQRRVGAGEDIGEAALLELMLVPVLDVRSVCGPLDGLN